jgi:hypothetical protein
MLQVTTAIWSLIFTTLIGGYIVQAWQRRSWHLQQRFLGHEKEYSNLKELTDELLSMLGARIYHMKRIVLSVNLEDPKFITRLSEYDDIIKRWNERLASFYSRLAILDSYGDSIKLEDIQTKLNAASGLIDNVIKSRSVSSSKDRGTLKPSLKSLNSIQAAYSNFSQSLLNRVETKRFEVYYGKYVPYNRCNLKFFSTWQLAKALCVRNVESHHILCSTLDLRFPARRG